mgnify:CR=1 FL=1
MVKFTELIKPGSGKSSTRYVGIVSLYAIIAIMFIMIILSAFEIEIPKNNSDIIESITYTLGGVVIGVFTKLGWDNKNRNKELKNGEVKLEEPIINENEESH